MARLNKFTQSEKQATAIYKNMRITTRKLALVANSIAGCKAENALQQLTFSKRPIAREVKKCLNSAIANAEHNCGLDIDNLVVSEAKVGKGKVIKRLMPRARGKGARIEKSFSHLQIIVKEKE